MAKASFKKNDNVFVITGDSKGKSGKVLEIDRRKGRVLIEGINLRKKTQRRSQADPQGGIKEIEAPVHISNVMHEDLYRSKHAEKKQ